MDLWPDFRLWHFFSFLFCVEGFFSTPVLCFHGFCSNKQGSAQGLTTDQPQHSLKWHHQTQITHYCIAKPTKKQSRPVVLVGMTNRSCSLVKVNWKSIHQTNTHFWQRIHIEKLSVWKHLQHRVHKHPSLLVIHTMPTCVCLQACCDVGPCTSLPSRAVRVQCRCPLPVVLKLNRSTHRAENKLLIIRSAAHIKQALIYFKHLTKQTNSVRTCGISSLPLSDTDRGWAPHVHTHMFDSNIKCKSS